MTASAYQRPAGVLLTFIFLSALLAPGRVAPEGAQTASGDSVILFLSARDAQGRLISDLQASEIRIRDQGTRLRIGTFRKAGAEPLTVGLLIDASGSRRFQLPAAEREGAAQFLSDIARMRGSAFVQSFGEYVLLHADLTADAGEMQSGLQQALQKPVQGSSSLYTAILQASRRFLAAQDGRKILVVTSDGVDNSSLATDRRPKEVAKRLVHDETILYAIVLADPSDDQTSPSARRDGLKKMKLIAERTGGEALAAKSAKEVTSAFRRITETLAEQYRLEFTPKNPPRPGQFRGIRVDTTRKKTALSAPNGYFALEP